MSLLASIFGASSSTAASNQQDAPISSSSSSLSLFDESKVQEFTCKKRAPSTNKNDETNNPEHDQDGFQKQHGRKLKKLKHDQQDARKEEDAAVAVATSIGNKAVIGTNDHKDENDDDDDNDSNSNSGSSSSSSSDTNNDNQENTDSAVKDKAEKNNRLDEKSPKQADSKDNNKIEEKDDDIDDVKDRTIFVGNLPICFTRKDLEKLFRPCGPIESTRIRSLATTGVKVPQASAGNQNLVKRVSANLLKVDSDAKPSVVGFVVFQKNKTATTTTTTTTTSDDPNSAHDKDPSNNDNNNDKNNNNINKNDNDNVGSNTSPIESVQRALKMNNTLVQDDTGASRRIRVDHIDSEYDSARSIFVGNLPYRTDEETLRNHFCQGCDLKDEDVEGVRVVRDKDTYQCKGFAYLLFKDKSMVSSALRLMHGSTYMNRELRVMVCSRRYKSYKQADGKNKKLNQKDNKKYKGNDASPSSPSSNPVIKPAVAALRRILEKEGTGEMSSHNNTSKQNKRLRGTKKSSQRGVASAGKSRRAIAEAKANKRVKKMQKRISKGMGKSKHT